MNVLPEYNLTKRIIVTEPDKRITDNYMSRFEKTRCIAIRTEQIAQSGKSFCDPKDIVHLDSAIEIAKKEIETGKSPLIIVRTIKETPTEVYVEKWSVSELKLKI